MDIAAVLLLALVGGWAFALRWRLTRWTTLRGEGQQSYFRAAFFGVVIFIAAWLVRVILRAEVPAFADFDDTLLESAGELLTVDARPLARAVFVTASYSALLGPLIASALNLLTPKGWVLKKVLSPQDCLLFDAQREGLPVSLTLLTGRVYVGVVVAVPDPERPPLVITLLPMYSGYRDQTGRLILTTDYESVYNVLKEDEAAKSLKLPTDWQRTFSLAIRADQVVSATMFVPAVFARFNPHWRESLSPATPPPRPLDVRVATTADARPFAVRWMRKPH